MRVLGSSVLAAPLVLVAVLLSVSVTPASAVASPFPMPFMRNADYDGHMLPGAHATRFRRRSHEISHNATHSTRQHGSHHSSTSSLSSEQAIGTAVAYPASRSLQRQLGLDGLLGGLSSHSSSAMSDSQDLQDMAQQSASQSANDPEFQQNAAAKFSSFQSNSQGFSDLLGQLAADKGLANYDKRDKLETILKDYVNSNKDALSAVDVMIQNLPALGPILGPIVHEVKCITDDLLNITENLTDGLLNMLKPLLSGLSGQAGDMTCGSQLKVLGFCL